MFTFDGIVLKKLQRHHLDLLLALKEESYANTHHITIANMEDQERWFDSLDKNVHTPSSLCLIASNQVATNFGIIKLTNVDWASRSGDLAWDVLADYRGRGLGRELVKAGVVYCFQILNLRRLTAEILETNIPSQKCATSAGFRQEGVKREAIHKFDRYLDSLVFGVLRSDLHESQDQV